MCLAHFRHTNYSVLVICRDVAKKKTLGFSTGSAQAFLAFLPSVNFSFSSEISTCDNLALGG